MKQVASLLGVATGKHPVPQGKRRSKEPQMRKQLFSLLAVVLIMGLLAPLTLAQGGMLAGRVTDSETGEIIVGATVTFDNHVPSARVEPSEGRIELTDSGGNYTLLGLASGSWNMTVEFEGYQENPGQVTIRNGRNTPINIELDRIPHPLEVALGQEALEGLDAEALSAQLDAADAAYENQEWEEALAGFNSLFETLPTMTSLQLSIAATLQQLGRFEEAIAAYETAAAADPSVQADVENAILRLRVAMGDLSAAADLASSGNAVREDLYNLGEVEFAQGNADGAAEWYEKAVAADPNWVLPLFKLGLVSLNKGDIESAKGYFAQVVEKDPTSAEGAQAQAVLGQLP